MKRWQHCFRSILFPTDKNASRSSSDSPSGPVSCMEIIFKGLTGKEADARQLALDFYGPIFLMYSLYDAADEKEEIITMLELHVEHFTKML